MPTVAPPLSWDIFCRVIDNLGDVGVCWRLSRDLASRGQQVRLWMDQTDALAWMAPGAREGRWPGIEVRSWETDWPHERNADLTRSDVWIEAFGCEPPDGFIRQQRALWTDHQAPVWINLEYLSAEPYVERTHRLPSPLMSGPASGWTRWFFYPGFSAATGGLLREADVAQRQAIFDRQAWREAARHPPDAMLPGGAITSERWISLFCYEPPALPWLLDNLLADAGATLVVTPGRAEAAVRQHTDLPSRWILRPLVDQDGFDQMLWACDLNFVRGEDSLVRALWAGQAFVWQIYPQHDNAHHDKLQAFLNWLDAPDDLRELHRFWNGMGGKPPPDLAAARLANWQAVTRQARARLGQQDDLTTQLLGFVMEKR